MKTKKLIGYIAIIKFKEDGEEAERFILIGAYKEGVNDSEDENTFYWIERAEEIAVLINEGTQDFIVLSAAPEYEEQKEVPATLKQINEQLYAVLCAMLSTRKGWDENGQIDFYNNDLDSLEQTVAYIKIWYFLDEPDGGWEQEEYKEFKKHKKKQISDVQAYEELACRLNNTRINEQ